MLTIDFPKSYKGGIPAGLPSQLIPQIKTFISTTDISLLSQSLTTLALLLELSPSTTFPEVEHDLLNDIYTVAHSPLVSGVALESLFRFFSTASAPVPCVASVSSCSTSSSSHVLGRQHRIEPSE